MREIGLVSLVANVNNDIKISVPFAKENGEYEYHMVSVNPYGWRNGACGFTAVELYDTVTEKKINVKDGVYEIEYGKQIQFSFETDDDNEITDNLVINYLM